MTRFLPRRLSTQLILAAVSALICAQAVTFPLFLKARSASVSGAIQESTVARTASLARLLVTAPKKLDAAILDSVNSRVMKAALSSERPTEVSPQPHSPELQAQLISAAEGAIVQAAVFAANAPPRDQPIIVIHAQLSDGQWLRAQLKLPSSSAIWALTAMIAAAVISLLLAGIMALMLRRITNPLARLSSAAEALGRGQEIEPLPEQGPQDIVETIRAFNQMQIRIREHIEERSRTLASVSHDLRTPITALRLQLEFIEDPAQKEQMMGTLSEMEAVTESALSYLKNTRSSEASRRVDVAALLDSACQELHDIGFNVEHEYKGRIHLACRPVLLKRALSNLVRNAAQYGERARVSIVEKPDHVEIHIEDQGPGIPVEKMAEVMKPFVRLEQSRNRDTGGSGLGLSIAKEIIAMHGGTLELRNLLPRGLSQCASLPKTQAC